MAVSPEALELLVSAARTAYTCTDPVQRKQADEFIAASKRDAGRGVAHLGFALVPPSAQPDPCITHFALHLLEHAVEEHWNSYSGEEHSQWRQALLSIVAACAQEPTSASFGPPLQKKLAALVAMIALREWPQNWPELLPSLGAAWQMGGAARRLTLHCLAELAEAADGCEYRSDADRSGGPVQRWDVMQIVHRRKVEVIQGIQDAGQNLLLMCSALVQDGTAKPEELERCIELMEALAGMLSHTDFARNGCLHALSKLVSEPRHCTRSAEVIHRIVERADMEQVQEPDREASAVFLQFLCSILHTALQFVRQTAGISAGQFDSDLAGVEAGYVFACRLADVSEATRKNAKVFSAVVSAEQGRQVVLQLTASLLSHPALRLHFCGAMLCDALLGSDAPVPPPTDQEFWLQLLRALRTHHLARAAGQPDPCSASATQRFASLDFEDDSEAFLVQYASLTSTVRRALQRMPKRCPGVCIRFIAEVTDSLATGTSSGVYAWAAADTALGYLTDSLKVSDLQQNQAEAQELLRVLAKLCCACNVTDPAILVRLIGLIQNLSSLLGQCFQELFEPVVRRLLDISHFLSQVPSSAEIISLRRKALMALSHLAQACGTQMVPQLGAMVGVWRGALQKATAHTPGAGQDLRYSDSELPQLTETCAQLSNQLPPDQQAAVLAELIAPCLQPWTSLSYVFSPEPLVQLLATVAAEGEGAGSGPAASLRRTLALLASVYRRCSFGAMHAAGSPVAQLSAGVLGPLLQCISAMHRLYDPTPAILASAHAPIIAIMLGPEPREDTRRTGQHTNSPQAPPASAATEAARYYLGQLRLCAYGLLGSLCYLSPSPYDRIGEVQQLALGPGINRLPPNALKTFFAELCLPLLLFTPPHFLAGVLPSLSCSLWKFLFDRLQSSWAEWILKEESGEHPDHAVEAEWKALNDVTEEVVCALNHIAAIGSGTEPKFTRLKRYLRGDERDAQTISASCVTLVKNPQLTAAMLPLLGAALLWPSTPGALKAVEAIHKFVNVGAATTVSAGMVHVMGCALQRIARMKQSEQGQKRSSKDSALLESCCHVIAEIYYAMRAAPDEAAALLCRVGVPSHSVMVLHQRLERDGRAPQKRRAHFRELLNPARQRDFRGIQDLPEYNILRRRRSPRSQPADGQVPLSQFFPSPTKLS